MSDTPLATRHRLMIHRAGLWEMVSAALVSSRFTLDELLSRSREPRRLVLFRKDLWARAFNLRDELGRRTYTMADIGRLFNRDHSTIRTALAEDHGKAA